MGDIFILHYDIYRNIAQLYSGCCAVCFSEWTGVCVCTVFTDMVSQLDAQAISLKLWTAMDAA